ncbi:MAG TPA: rhomboid family intramembrane serine protease [Natronosporangium sp.]
MGELARPDDAPPEFGTEAFYASIGRAFVVMCAVVPVLLLVELVNLLTDHNLARAGGIVPRQLYGLDGIVLAPFLHGSFEHVAGNGIALILVGTFVLADGVRRTLWSTALIMLVAGAGVWLLGDLFFQDGERVGPHVGASGVVFGYLGLLLTRGILERSLWSSSVALLIGALYGVVLWQGIQPTQQGISWEGHLFGLIGGIAAAIVFRRRRPSQPADRLPTTAQLS